MLGHGPISGTPISSQSGGVMIYFRSLVASSAGIGTRVRSVLKSPKSAVTTATTLLKSAGKILTSTVIVTASFRRAVSRLLLAVQPTSVAVAISKRLRSTVTAASNTVAAISRVIGYRITATEYLIATLSGSKSITKFISTTVSNIAALLKSAAVQLSATAVAISTRSSVVQRLTTLIATGAAAVAVARIINKTMLAATVTTTAMSLRQRLNKIMTTATTAISQLQLSRVSFWSLFTQLSGAATTSGRLNRVLTATATGAGAIVTRLGKLLSAIGLAGSNIGRVAAFFRSVTATVSTVVVVTRIKQLRLAMSAAAAGVGVILKALSVPLRYVSTTTATQSRVIMRVLSAGCNSVLTILRGRLWVMQMVAACKPTISVAVAKILKAVVTTAAVVVTRLNKVVTAVIGSIAGIARWVAYKLLPTRIQTLKLRSTRTVIKARDAVRTVKLKPIRRMITVATTEILKLKAVKRIIRLRVRK